MADKKKADDGAVKDTKVAEKGAGKKAKAKAEVPVELEAPQAAVAPKPQTKSVKVPKFAKKNKQRLPRREREGPAKGRTLSSPQRSGLAGQFSINAAIGH